MSTHDGDGEAAAQHHDDRMAALTTVLATAARHDAARWRLRRDMPTAQQQRAHRDAEHAVAAEYADIMLARDAAERRAARIATVRAAFARRLGGGQASGRNSTSRNSASLPR
jgi:hypothetical protein